MHVFVCVCVCVYSINLEVQKNAIGPHQRSIYESWTAKATGMSVFHFMKLSITAGGWLCLSFALRICPSWLVVDCVCLSLYEFVHHGCWLTVSVFRFTNLSIMAGGWLCLSFALRICPSWLVVDCLSFALRICPSWLVVDCVCLSLYEFVHHGWWLAVEREKDCWLSLYTQKPRTKIEVLSMLIFFVFVCQCQLFITRVL